MTVMAVTMFYFIQKVEWPEETYCSIQSCTCMQLTKKGQDEPCDVINQQGSCGTPVVAPGHRTVIN